MVLFRWNTEWSQIVLGKIFDSGGKDKGTLVKVEMTNMARKKRLLVPEAQTAVNQFKNKVMGQQGYNVNPMEPSQVKFEVAKELNIPLKKGYNGTLTSKQAGEVGGKIGGSMVKEMIRMAQQSLKK